MAKIESISVFDMLKIGVGPSSSHTLGPWRAAGGWISKLREKGNFDLVEKITVEIYGSLSLTGKGHATDIAILLGLEGLDPQTFPIDEIPQRVQRFRNEHKLLFDSERPLDFDPSTQIIVNRKFKEFHPNGITFRAVLSNGKRTSDTFYSIGGGFVVQKERKRAKMQQKKLAGFPFPVQSGEQLLRFCDSENKKISEIVWANELSLAEENDINTRLKKIWEVMLDSMFVGCHTEGTLPGGLNVRRRAYDMHLKLIDNRKYNNADEWIAIIRNGEIKFRQILKWVSCFALAVNEVNASMGRVVTAPTNGSAGVIPAVIMYYMVIENHDANFDDVKQFLLTAGEIGSLFKKGATISAAMGGCQAEIGVSSAMAAGALAELMGGSPEQVLMASEIAMEHHLGLTCDPIAGLVQIPCIERNAMGAIKAINACEMALDTDARNAKVPLDKVIETMWQTAQDMNHKYKETSEGGLAVNVALSDC
jgi:L-serine dehydratase